MEYKLKLLGRPCYVETGTILILLLIGIILSTFSDSPFQYFIGHLLGSFTVTIGCGYLVGFIRENIDEEE